MTVTVLVPTWRRADDLRRALEGLRRQDRRPDEVLVAVRHDDADTWSALEEMKETTNGLNLRPVRVEGPGVVASLNAGLDSATGEIVAITDDDSVPRRDWVSGIVEAFARNGDVGGVGGRDWVHEGGRLVDGVVDRVGTVRWFGRVVGGHHLGAGPPREVDVLKGVNMAFRTRALDGIRLNRGLRGSGMQMHWEIDLCLAVKQAGWKLLYDPAIAVDHYPAARLDEATRRGLSPGALGNEVYNETSGLLRGLPLWRRVAAFAYGMVIGTRLAPGPVTALEQRLRGVAVGPALLAATRARLQALADFLRRQSARAGRL